MRARQSAVQVVALRWIDSILNLIISMLFRKMKLKCNRLTYIYINEYCTLYNQEMIFSALNNRFY